MVIAVVIIYLFFYGKSGYEDLRRVRREVGNLQTLQDSLKSEIERIEADIEAARADDPETIERQARRWGLTRPDEEIILIEVDSSNFEGLDESR